MKDVAIKEYIKEHERKHNGMEVFMWSFNRQAVYRHKWGEFGPLYLLNKPRDLSFRCIFGNRHR